MILIRFFSENHLQLTFIFFTYNKYKMIFFILMQQGLSLNNNPSITPQSAIISALGEYNRIHQSSIFINESGICAALSISFAFSHRIKEETGSLTPELFKNLLEQISSLERIDAFFNKIKDLTESYQQASEKASKEYFLKELQPMWAQLAVLDFAILLYNKNKQYPTFVKPVISSLTLGFMGLEATGVASLSFNKKNLYELLFPINLQEQPSIQCPLALNGTYLIGFPGHLCAAHVTEDNKLFFYDPNHDEVISEIEQLKDYQKMFDTYALDDHITVDVIAVELINKKEEKQELQMASAWVKQILEASCHYYIKAHKNELKYRRFIVRPLCHINTPEAELVFLKVLQQCPQKNLKFFLEKIIKTLYVEQNFRILGLVLSQKHLEKWLQENQYWLQVICQQGKIELLLYALSRLPQGFTIEESLEDILNIMRDLSYAQGQHKLKKMIDILISASLLTQEKDPSLALGALIQLFPGDMTILTLAVKSWQQYCQDHHYRTTVVLQHDKRSLLEYLITNRYPVSLIEILVRDDSYLLTQRDCFAVFISPHEHVKHHLISHPHKLDNHFMSTPLLSIITHGTQHDLLSDFIRKEDRHELFKQCFILAALNEHFHLCTQLALHKKELIDLGTLKIAVLCSIQQQKKRSLDFLLELPTSDTTQLVEYAIERAISNHIKDIGLYLCQRYRAGAELFQKNKIRRSLRVQKQLSVALIEMALDIGITGQQLNDTNLWPTSPLSYVISAGRGDLVSRLLQRGSSPLTIWQNELTSFNTAATLGDITILQRLLNNGFDVNMLDQHGRTAAYYAVSAGQLPVLDLLIEYHADLSLGATPDDTPLVCSVFEKQYFLFNKLLYYGAQPLDPMYLLNTMKSNLFPESTYQKWAITFTETAIERNSIPILQDLKKHQAVINLAHINYAKGLFKAICDNNIAWLQLFFSIVEGKVRLDFISKRFNTTPLIMAVRENHLEVAKILLDAGASPNVYPHGQHPALYEALCESNLPMVALLIDYGARYNHSSECLFLAINQKDHLMLQKLLTIVPHNQDLINEAISYAQKQGKTQALTLLKAITVTEQSVLQNPPPVLGHKRRKKS